MTKVRNLPEITVLADDDLFYVVDDSAGPNGGRKIRKSNLTATAEAHANSHRPGGTDELSTAVPVTINADGNNDLGVSTSFSKADHKHNISTGAPSSQTPDQANAEGVSSNLARADHTHNIPAAAPTMPLSPAILDTEGVGTSFSRNDHTHSIVTALTASISTIQPDDAAAAGIADNYARGDHKHAIVCDVPSTQNPDQSNAEGVSTSFARADHIHNIPAAAPTTTLSPATSNAEGSGTSFARNDHTHAIATALVGDITTIQPDDAAAAGTADTYARGDHKHAIVAAAASSITTSSTNTEGASTSFARADHTHAVAITTATATATATTTTVNTADELISGMTNTPVAGTYMATFSASGVNSGNGASRMFISIYVGGVQIAHSERNLGISGAANVQMHTQAIFTVTGAEEIEVRWRAVAGTNSVFQRSLHIIKIG